VSKKKFTDGLESLFSLSAEENEKEEVLLVVEAEEKQKKTPTEKKKNKRKPSKSFTADLDSLFSGTISYNPEKKETTQAESKKEKAGAEKKKGPKVFSGLEALLRNTVDTARYNQTEPSKVKRVTFTFDKEKLVRLKKIAKTQKSYLKDIIGKVVSEYIEEYEKDQEKVVTE